MNPFWRGFLWPWCLIGWHRWRRVAWHIHPPVQQERCRICEKRRWVEMKGVRLDHWPLPAAPPSAGETTHE